VVDVMLILVDDDSVLLALREGTGYADGLWNLPSGKLEAGEDVVCAVVREAREEVGLCVGLEEVRMVVALHHRHPGGGARVGFFFEVMSAPGGDGAVDSRRREPVPPRHRLRPAWREALD
jgi:8-oxo-dGTP pyrophosphatase MutT (NUDIX family)